MQSIRSTYDNQGYVVVPSLISPLDFPLLVSACEDVIDRTRQGAWPHRRTVGKQFPPYDSKDPDSWGVQHVMHPELGASAEVFKKWYTSEALGKAVCELLRCKEEDLQMELFNLLINPTSHSFALRWHRDDIRENASEKEERERLGNWQSGVQWNTALYEDSCLYIVPGSHKHPRTEDQRALSMTMEPPANPLDMPGAIRLTLKPGETVFYNSNILHCATYDCTAKRATLHATMGDSRRGQERARNILQHGLLWMKEDKFRVGLNERGTRMVDKVLEFQRRVEESGEEVKFSLAG
ncbi:hypothetical protein K435DRAFT_680977 [Dendrothele bispora CBS 962.96]|uniref:Phytanoyl-CoA dioxygenase n=1 Tax=Dendrothele bispora (strain CBS 962.96) TaxID=1314807 RepID=A0A4V4HDM7_DENBC|nr:hypothetical protein K435DRAFT_680977 [Dendrothele bispora CBS 962.96]